MSSLLKFVARPHIVVGGTIILAFCAVLIAYFAVGTKPVAQYVYPTTGPIVEEVDTTGTVKAANTLDLGFQTGGRISYAGPSVGTKVAAGTTLVTLASADLQASVEQAQAALNVQQANLAAIQAGTRPEDLAVTQTAVSGAQAALLQSKQSLIAAAQDAYVKSDDAVHNKVDQFFNNPRTSSTSLVFGLSDSQLQSSIINQRFAMEALLASWQQNLAALSTDPNQIDVSALSSMTRSNLQQVGSFLDLTASGLTKVIPTGSYTTTIVQGYQNNVATGRSNVSSDVSALSTAQTAEKNAEAALASAQSQLALKQAGATPEALAAQRAQVAVAQANLDAARAQLGKSVISAPIAGTITVNNAHVGEIAAPGVPLISMISNSQFQFETYVSQTDLAKVKVGQSANVKLDAYENAQPLSAHIIAVDPAATLQNGVSSYKITLQFDQDDLRIQAGLTGSVSITTQSKDSALSVPSSAIITRGTSEFVLRSIGGHDEMAPVTVGVSSRSGMTEILSGVTSSDRIRTFGVQQ